MAAARVKLAALFVACRPCPARMNRAEAPSPTPSHPSRVFPFLCRSTALVSDIIAPLHFANDPMQQARSDHFVLAKLRRDVLSMASRADSATGLAACINRSKSWAGSRSRSWSSGVTASAPQKTRMRQPDFGSQTASPPFVGCTVQTQGGGWCNFALRPLPLLWPLAGDAGGFARTRHLPCL